MTSRPLLSICIPTYNREFFLRACLASIQLDGVRDLVEVIVSDNASTDHTLKVLEEFSTILPLRWKVQETNIGSDRNFDSIVTEARGEYCWLLGSDDVVQLGAVPRLVAALMSLQTDIVQFGYVQGDIHLCPQHEATPPPGLVQSSRRGIASYLAAQPNLSLLFTFISAFAFRRSVWMSRQAAIRLWIGSNYIQMFAMHSAVASGASLVAIDECFVIARGGNPNEFNVVPGCFIALDARSMSRLIHEVYGDRLDFWQAIGKPFYRSYPAKTLIVVAANGGLVYINESRETLLSLGYSKKILCWLRLLHSLKLLPVIKWLLDSRRRVLKILISKVH